MGAPPFCVMFSYIRTVLLFIAFRKQNHEMIDKKEMNMVFHPQLFERRIT